MKVRKMMLRTTSLFLLIASVSQSLPTPAYAATQIVALTNTGQTTWVVPPAWNNTNNMISIIGGGGNGFSTGAQAGAGGGGGNSE